MTEDPRLSWPISSPRTIRSPSGSVMAAAAAAGPGEGGAAPPRRRAKQAAWRGASQQTKRKKGGAAAPARRSGGFPSWGVRRLPRAYRRGSPLSGPETAVLGG